MIEILSLTNMVPAVITYRQGNEDKSMIVYIDYASRNIIPTEEVDSIEELRDKVFTHITKSRKPPVIPDMPKGGFAATPEKFDADY
jgi:hypothetical protein